MSTEHLLAYTLHNALQNTLVVHCIDVKKRSRKKHFKMLKVLKIVAEKMYINV